RRCRRNPISFQAQAVPELRNIYNEPGIGADIGFPEIDVPRAAGPLIGDESLIGDDPVIHSSPRDFVEYRPLYERLRRLRLEDDNSEDHVNENNLDETGQPFEVVDEG
ncbi:hypothetical protein OnM2_082049, partial [Erysiphe neolycopersici]